MFGETIRSTIGRFGCGWRGNTFEQLPDLGSQFSVNGVIVSTKKIGIIFGMENSFPPAVVEKINRMKVEGVTAEFVKLGGVKMADPSGYRVIIDRISQDISF